MWRKKADTMASRDFFKSLGKIFAKFDPEAEKLLRHAWKEEEAFEQEEGEDDDWMLDEQGDEADETYGLCPESYEALLPLIDVLEQAKFSFLLPRERVSCDRQWPRLPDT